MIQKEEIPVVLLLNEEENDHSDHPLPKEAFISSIAKRSGHNHNWSRWKVHLQHYLQQLTFVRLLNSIVNPEAAGGAGGGRNDPHGDNLKSTM
ncbi:hypothetical protein HAX54_020750 [Datura stramonium]|uniref:Uncharacterized protein n=1 Tax=Datura stramonium TaxID=4076 RepID=A0ABS8RJJ8_DATST|nr:hypothetical protein [Datura stramonium]